MKAIIEWTETKFCVSNSTDFINKITTEDFSNPGKEIDNEKQEHLKHQMNMNLK